MKYRQVHLDFHTSEKIEKIGSQFDKKQWQVMLKKGHVNSITLFSKCHHGWSYHPTKVNEIHPNLNFDLLKAQIEACQEIGVKTPIYISAGLDEKEAIRHPEWLVRFEDETTTWVSDFVHKAGYHLLCFNTGYLELLLKQIEEVMVTYQPEAIFLDITAVHPCYCHRCRQDIIERGKDIRDIKAVMEQGELVYRNYTTAVKKLVRKYSDTCRIFHNSGHVTRGRRDILSYDTHFELESLPTGGWGYDHFPLSAAYVQNMGKEYLGMTGKFHNAWGEFGGFKHPKALTYETGLSLALGAGCSVGDQLHPLGHLDESTYELIGKAYAEIEKREEWCFNTNSLPEVAVLGDEVMNAKVSNRDEKRFSDTGANRMLLEGKYLYSFIDLESDFSDYKVLILPDTIEVDKNLKERLNQYLEQGGKILASGKSGVEMETQEFAVDFGCKYQGKSKYLPDYFIPNFDLATGKSPHIMYGNSYYVSDVTGEVVGWKQDSYFNRDINHFCSHQHTPNNPETNYPGIILTDKTAYISWEVFSDYADKGSLHCKEIVIFLLDKLLGKNRTIRTNLPDKAVTTLRYQKEKDRYIQHLLFAHTTIRGTYTFSDIPSNVEVIEDIVPLYDVKVSVKIDKPINKVYLVPEKEELTFKQEDGRVEYQLPKLFCHQMVVFE